MNQPDKSETPDQFFEVVDLPQPDWNGYWSDIVVADSHDTLLLNYIKFVIFLGIAEILVWGLYKTISLVGPPGNGKTTKARGLANEVAKMVQSKTNKETKLLMVKAESCFSHFLGATAKNLGQLFETVRWLARRYVVIVLIDEVESLAFDRKAVAANPHEPSDIMRGVNKLLTELDRLREVPGVLVVMTSNLDEVIDGALKSRTDLTLQFALPDLMTRAKIIEMTVDKLSAWLQTLSGQQVAEIAANTEGYSGRDLVRLPFWAMLISGKSPGDLEFGDYLQAISWLNGQKEEQRRKEERVMKERKVKLEEGEKLQEVEQLKLESEEWETDASDDEQVPLELCEAEQADDQSCGDSEDDVEDEIEDDAEDESNEREEADDENDLAGDDAKEEEVLERYLNLGPINLPERAAKLLIKTIDGVAQWTNLPKRKKLPKAWSRIQKCLALLIAAQLVEHIDVCFAGEVLRIHLLYFPDADGTEDNLDLAVLEYAEITTEELEIRVCVTDIRFAYFLGAHIFVKISMPGLTFSLVEGQGESF